MRICRRPLSTPPPQGINLQVIEEVFRAFHNLFRFRKERFHYSYRAAEQKMSTSTIYDVSLRPMRWMLIFWGTVPPFLGRSCGPLLAVTAKCLHMCIAAVWIFWFSYMHFNMAEKIMMPVDVFSQALDLFGKTILVATHIVIQAEGTWKQSYYDSICSRLETVRLLLATRFGRRINCSAIQRRFRLLYWLMALLNLAMIAIVLEIFVSGLLKANMSFSIYSEIAAKLKFYEFMFCTMLIVIMLEEILAVAKFFAYSLLTQHMIDSEIVNRLCDFQDLHSQLWLVVQDISAYFECCLCCLLLKVMIDVTLVVYWTYMSFMKRLHILVEIYCLTFFVYYVIVLIIICTVASKCESLDKQFGRVFQRMQTDRHNHLWNLGLRTMNLNLSHEAINFRLIGNFSINRNFLAVFMLSVVSYSVILIQMKMEV